MAFSLLTMAETIDKITIVFYDTVSLVTLLVNMNLL